MVIHIPPHISLPVTCNFRYYYEEDFKRHRQRCLDLEVFQCQDCDFFSSSMKVQSNVLAFSSHTYVSPSGDCRTQDVKAPVESLGGPETESCS